MRFEWDGNKNAQNQSKHHLSFENAREGFDDPLHISKLDQVIETEQRWMTIGVVGGLVVVVVVHTFRDDGDEEVVRIISARRATRHERREYENG